MSKFRPPSDPTNRPLNGDEEEQLVRKTQTQTSATTAELRPLSGIDDRQPEPRLHSSGSEDSMTPVARPGLEKTSNGRSWLLIAILILAGASLGGICLIAVELGDVKQSLQQSKVAVEAATRAASAAEAAANALKSAVKTRELSDGQTAENGIAEHNQFPQQRSSKAIKKSRAHRTR